ncbi:hypothetical protein [uncultured Clostridium sp.]|uniref:hypothetical protein n=1 Tax=uncultured Clostridium sp. TaxID=59620 RepID=UPI00260C19AB|nr:hypothetical protein [uncultured Clostridium sp.]
MSNIIKINYNWFNYNDGNNQGEDYYTFEVGKSYKKKGTVTEIREHPAVGEGDRWFYDVHFDSGAMERIFNPNHIFYKQA